MRVQVKDIVVYVMILALAAFFFVQLTMLKAQVQASALANTVNRNTESINQIVDFLNKKPWERAPAGIPMPPPPKK